MKKIKLTDEEKRIAKECWNLSQKGQQIMLELQEKRAIFWKKFQTRYGVGNYNLNLKTQEVTELSESEIAKMQGNSSQ